MSVEQVAKTLNSTKGAAYEIFHVFESLLLVTKIGTNTYRWNGFGYMNETLSFLWHIGKYMLEIDADSDRVTDYEVEERLREPEQLAEAAATVHDLPQGKRKHEKQIHVLQSCQKFVMLFLVTPPPRALSLEFASKVIHGTDLPTEVLKSRTRRLYDLANILTNFPEDYRLFKKVSKSSVQAARRTYLQYQGPDVSDNTLSEADILRLPDYRRKHLFFKPGKIFFGIPERPEKIPRTTTVRLNLDENDKHYLDKEKNFGLSLDMMTASAISDVISPETICAQEASRYSAKQIVKQEIETFGSEQPPELWLGILPSQPTMMECFELPGTGQQRVPDGATTTVIHPLLGMASTLEAMEVHLPIS